jgi:hypothetical protein
MTQHAVSHIADEIRLVIGDLDARSLDRVGFLVDLVEAMASVFSLTPPPLRIASPIPARSVFSWAILSVCSRR